jgi:hypothetical protein
VLDTERENLLKLMFSLKTDDKSAITIMFDILSSSLIGGQVRILGTEPSTVFLAIFALVPALWNKYKRAAEADDVAQTLSDLGKIPDARPALADICYCEKRSAESIKSLSAILGGRVGRKGVRLLLRFLAQVVKHGTRSQREAVYGITDAIIALRRKVAKSQEVSNIAYSASIDFECQWSPIARDFLRTMMKNDILAQNSAQMVAGKFSMFPALPSSALDVRHWKPQVKDVFPA